MAGITWNVRIHGHKHRIICKPEINKYVIFVDDDHLTNIYRDSLKDLRYGAEKTIRICSQDCLFVVWDERPDLVVDGILQGRGEYPTWKQKRIAAGAGYWRTAFCGRCFWRYLWCCWYV